MALSNYLVYKIDFYFYKYKQFSLLSLALHHSHRLLTIAVGLNIRYEEAAREEISTADKIFILFHFALTQIEHINLYS